MGASPPSSPRPAAYNSAFVRCFAGLLFPASPTYVRAALAWGEKRRRQEDHSALAGPPHPREAGCPLGKRCVPSPPRPESSLGLPEVHGPVPPPCSRPRSGGGGWDGARPGAQHGPRRRSPKAGLLRFPLSFPQTAFWNSKPEARAEKG